MVVVGRLYENHKKLRYGSKKPIDNIGTWQDGDISTKPAIQL